MLHLGRQRRRGLTSRHIWPDDSWKELGSQHCCGRSLLLLLFRLSCKMRSHWLKAPCHSTLLVFHVQGGFPINKCGFTRVWGVKSGIDISCMSVKLIFAYDGLFIVKFCYSFHSVPDWWSVLQIFAWFEHCQTLQMIKWAPLKYFWKGEKNRKFRWAPEGNLNRENLRFLRDSRVFLGEILRTECNTKSPWEHTKGKLLKVTSVLHPPCPVIPQFLCYFQKKSNLLRQKK